MSRLNFKETAHDDTSSNFKSNTKGQNRSYAHVDDGRSFTAGVVIDLDSDVEDNDPFKPYDVGNFQSQNQSDTYTLLGVRDIRNRKRSRNDEINDTSQSTKVPSVVTVDLTNDQTAGGGENCIAIKSNNSIKNSVGDSSSSNGTGKKNKKRKRSGDEASAGEENASSPVAASTRETTDTQSFIRTSIPANTSQYLNKFLKTHRDPTKIPPAPPIDIANDIYLREFHRNFESQRHENEHDVSGYWTEDTSDQNNIDNEDDENDSNDNKTQENEDEKINNDNITIMKTKINPEKRSRNLWHIRLDISNLSLNTRHHHLKSSFLKQGYKLTTSNIKRECDGTARVIINLHASNAVKDTAPTYKTRNKRMKIIFSDDMIEPATINCIKTLNGLLINNRKINVKNAIDTIPNNNNCNNDNNNNDDDDTSSHDDDDDDDSSSDDDEKEQKNKNQWLLELDISNLPFHANNKKLRKFLLNKGYQAKTIHMNGNKKQGKENDGTAMVVIDLRKSPAVLKAAGINIKKKKSIMLPKSYNSAMIPIAIGKCLETLHSSEYFQRAIRVQRRGFDLQQALIKSAAGDNSRYFTDGNISIKCLNCGHVGHTQKVCTVPIAIRCHLCAGIDHDASRCPNITCFRCGCFGHHSRDCTNKSSARPRICTFCGVRNHEQQHCFNLFSPQRGGELDQNIMMAGPYVKCMSCNRYGHTLCHRLPKVANNNSGFTEVYCPNCGEEGHHVDYPVISFRRNMDIALAAKANQHKRARHSTGGMNDVNYGCQEPRYEAFMKYNQLVKDIGRHVKDKAEYQRNLLPSRPSANDLQMFPALEQVPPDLHLPRSYVELLDGDGYMIDDYYEEDNRYRASDGNRYQDSNRNSRRVFFYASEEEHYRVRDNHRPKKHRRRSAPSR